MGVMRRLALLVAASATAASATTCAVPARAADPELPVAAEAGHLDGGFVRVLCEGTVATQRCVLRFPEGFRRLNVRYFHSNDYAGTMSTWDHSTPGRARDEVRTFNRRIVSGVRVSCSTTGAVVDCDVRLREQVRDYRDTYWSAGTHQGGLIWQLDR